MFQCIFEYQLLLFSSADLFSVTVHHHHHTSGLTQNMLYYMLFNVNSYNYNKK